MRLVLFFVIGILVLPGCDLAIKNGLFACGQPTDCPSGYFCWSSDNRCYDSKEPGCEPKSCEQLISEFAALGFPIECGSLPDGCDGSIECGGCPDGDVCGANGQNFICGCEENTCTSVNGGAECGFVPTRCGGDEDAIFCGECPGTELACVDNKCVCPPGRNCDDACMDQCSPEEVCVNGECCTPTYPCSKNECSPPGGLPDGCGGFASCPPCANDEECVFSDDLVFQCLDDCTCEAVGVECGTATTACGPALCGTCADNGFGEGYRCEDGSCVCDDQFEYNDDFDNFAPVCGLGTGVSCLQEAWSVDIQATLHDGGDVDLYALQVLDAWTPIVAQTYNGWSGRKLYMTYLCPDGYVGMYDCSGYWDQIEGIQFCVGTQNVISISRSCDGSGEPGTGQVGTLLVGVEPYEFSGQCDPYGLKVIATYEAGIPPL